MTTKGKIFTWAGIILALALAGFIYFRFYFVFGDGVKAGVSSTSSSTRAMSGKPTKAN